MSFTVSQCHNLPLFPSSASFPLLQNHFIAIFHLSNTYPQPLTPLPSPGCDSHPHTSLHSPYLPFLAFQAHFLTCFTQSPTLPPIRSSSTHTGPDCSLLVCHHCNAVSCYLSVGPISPISRSSTRPALPVGPASCRSQGSLS